VNQLGVARDSAGQLSQLVFQGTKYALKRLAMGGGGEACRDSLVANVVMGSGPARAGDHYQEVYSF